MSYIIIKEKINVIHTNQINRVCFRSDYNIFPCEIFILKDEQKCFRCATKQKIVYTAALCNRVMRRSDVYPPGSIPYNKVKYTYKSSLVHRHHSVIHPLKGVVSLIYVLWGPKTVATLQSVYIRTSWLSRTQTKTNDKNKQC